MAGMLGVQRGDFDLIERALDSRAISSNLLVQRCATWLQTQWNPPSRPAVIRNSRANTGPAAPICLRGCANNLGQHTRGAVGKFHIWTARNAADLMQILRHGFGDFRLALQHCGKQTVARDNVINQFQARPGFERAAAPRAGKNQRCPTGEDGQAVRQ